MKYFRCDLCDWTLWFSDVIDVIDQWGWILPLQHRCHIHSVHHLILFCNHIEF